MSDEPLQLLLIDSQPADAGAVRHLLEDSGERFELRWAGSLLAGLDALGSAPVDAILLELNLPDSRGFETFTAVRLHAPGMPLLIWTDMDNQALALRAVEGGAEDFLIKDRLSGPALARALRYSMARHRARSAAAESAKVPRSSVLGLMGAKGGVGTTAIACHLAAELRLQSGDPVVLLDLDFDTGLAAFWLQVRPAYSMRDAVENLHRLDLAFWKGIVAPHSSGLDVLGAPPAPAELPPADRIRHVIRFLRLHYRWIVLDLGRAEKLAPVMRETAQVFVISTLEAASLYQVKRLLARLADPAGGCAAATLIVNRAPRRVELAALEVKDLVGVQPGRALLSDYRALDEASTQGHLLPETSPLRRQIAAWAADLLGVKPKPEPALLRRFAGR